jgi:hypothetical protein
MTLILSGDDGTSDVDGTAATPAIRGTDTNTGVYFSSPDVVGISAGGVEVGRFNSTGFVGASVQSDVAKAGSGTIIQFTGIPSWVKQITMMLNDMGSNGSSQWLVQLGTSGGYEVTGYISAASFVGSTTGTTNQTAGYGIRNTSATHNFNGSLIISLLGSNTWVAQGLFSGTGGGSGFTYLTSGAKTLSGTLTQIRLNTVNGTDAFDSGTINILYQ